MISPWLTNSGTLTEAPVSSFASLVPPVTVSPRMPGSVSTIFSSTCGGGVTDSGCPFQSVTMHTVPSFSHCAASPTAVSAAANCSKDSGCMKCQNWPSAYRNCMSTSTTSAASSVSPDLKVRSMTRPVRRLRMRTRLKAWPLPGLTNSFSTIEQGSLSSMTFTPERKSLVLMLDMEFAAGTRSAGGGWWKRPRIIAAARRSGHPGPGA
jgi:hypothetical protein